MPPLRLQAIVAPSRRTDSRKFRAEESHSPSDSFCICHTFSSARAVDSPSPRWRTSPVHQLGGLFHNSQHRVSHIIYRYRRQDKSWFKPHRAILVPSFRSSSCCPCLPAGPVFHTACALDASGPSASPSPLQSSLARPCCRRKHRLCCCRCHLPANAQLSARGRARPASSDRKGVAGRQPNAEASGGPRDSSV